MDSLLIHKPLLYADTLGAGFLERLNLRESHIKIATENGKWESNTRY